MSKSCEGNLFFSELLAHATCTQWVHHQILSKAFLVLTTDF
jgi:hypothetical protein